MKEYDNLVEKVATKYSNDVPGGKYSKNEPFVLRRDIIGINKVGYVF